MITEYNPNSSLTAMSVHCTIDQPKTLKLSEVNTNDHAVTMQRSIGKLLDLAFMENITLTHTTVDQTTRPPSLQDHVSHYHSGLDKRI